MSGFLDNFKEGTGIKLAAQGAQVAWATGQAIHANIKYKQKMTDIENFQRQEIINPFQNLSNPYANLQVATKAAEMQAEQSDIALANTLDNLRETGAGGATALAQAALKSKQGISANIEQQEASNEKLRAQGEQQMEQMQMSEAQRIQGVQMSEGQRMQQAGAAGKQFMFGATEAREQQKIERVAGQLSGAAAQEGQAKANQMGALTGMIGGVASAAGSFMSAKGPTPPVVPSDRRLKQNINLIGKSNNGLNIYSFEYINNKHGVGLFQGVMSDEMRQEVITKGSDGYDRVNYSLLDVEFKQI